MSSKLTPKRRQFFPCLMVVHKAVVIMILLEECKKSFAQKMSVMCKFWLLWILHHIYFFYRHKVFKILKLCKSKLHLVTEDYSREKF